jgi:hypothetical protein
MVMEKKGKVRVGRIRDEESITFEGVEMCQRKFGCQEIVESKSGKSICFGSGGSHAQYLFTFRHIQAPPKYPRHSHAVLGDTRG